MFLPFLKSHLAKRVHQATRRITCKTVLFCKYMKMSTQFSIAILPKKMRKCATLASIQSPLLPLRRPRPDATIHLPCLPPAPAAKLLDGNSNKKEEENTTNTITNTTTKTMIKNMTNDEDSDDDDDGNHDHDNNNNHRLGRQQIVNVKIIIHQWSSTVGLRNSDRKDKLTTLWPAQITKSVTSYTSIDPKQFFKPKWVPRKLTSGHSI